MLHLGRTHKVSVAWLHEQNSGDSMTTSYCDSSLQCADIFTKAFNDKRRWGPVCRLIAHFYPEDLDFIANTHKAAPATSRAAQRGGNHDAKSRLNESSGPPAKPKTSTELKIQLEEARKKLARECQARNFKNCD